MDEIFDLIGSVSEGFPTYSSILHGLLMLPGKAKFVSCSIIGLYRNLAKCFS